MKAIEINGKKILILGMSDEVSQVERALIKVGQEPIEIGQQLLLDELMEQRFPYKKRAEILLADHDVIRGSDYHHFNDVKQYGQSLQGKRKKKKW